MAREAIIHGMYKTFLPVILEDKDYCIHFKFGMQSDSKYDQEPSIECRIIHHNYNERLYLLEAQSGVKGIWSEKEVFKRYGIQDTTEKKKNYFFFFKQIDVPTYPRFIKKDGVYLTRDQIQKELYEYVVLAYDEPIVQEILRETKSWPWYDHF